ncbi:MAG: DUF3263 domain-containing protein [Propionibacteriaceae bacterium]|jgi:hypothetical protein|nr:DUF3263 domain-containing protein [Propionibacteriaceae bacterium]
MTQLAPSAALELSEVDRRILDFEKSWWSLPGSKEAEIAEQFGFSSVRYYQQLNSLIDTEAALAYDPLLVKRLRRLRHSRQQERSARKLSLRVTV